MMANSTGAKARIGLGLLIMAVIIVIFLILYGTLFRPDYDWFPNRRARAQDASAESDVAEPAYQLTQHDLNLFAAIEKRIFDVIRFEVNQGANLEAINEDGFTPLIVAARIGDLDIMKILLAAGADIDGSDASGMTPLMHAARDHEVRLTEYLVEQGADVHLADNKGRSVLSWAIVTGRRVVPEMAIINLLRERAATVTIRDPEVTVDMLINMYNSPILQEALITPDGDIEDGIRRAHMLRQ